MSIKAIAKTSLAVSIMALSMVQLRSVLVNQVRGEAPLTAPLTGFITPTPTLEAPLTAPVTPTPTVEVPLTAPAQSTPTPTVEVPLTAPAQSTPTPTVTPTTAPSNNNSGSSDNGGSNNGGGGGSSNNGGGSSVCTNVAPKSGPLLTSVKKMTKTSAVLTWTKGWGPVNEYVIWYGTTKDAAMYTTAAIKGEEQVKTAVIAGLNPNTLYYFKIQPKNGCKTGSFSNTLTSNGRIILSTGYTQGVSLSSKTTSTKINSKPAQTSSPKPPALFNSINEFFKSIFK